MLYILHNILYSATPPPSLHHNLHTKLYSATSPPHHSITLQSATTTPLHHSTTTSQHTHSCLPQQHLYIAAQLSSVCNNTTFTLTPICHNTTCTPQHHSPQSATTPHQHHSTTHSSMSAQEASAIKLSARILAITHMRKVPPRSDLTLLKNLVFVLTLLGHSELKG